MAALLLLGLVRTPSAAQAQHYRFERFGAAVGIEAVRTLALDADAYLWAGTPGGLFRYDGARATPVALPGQPDAAVEHLAAGPGGGLWIHTRPGRLFYRPPGGRITPVGPLPDLVRTALIRDALMLRATPAGDLLVASGPVGLWHYRRATERWTRLALSRPGEPVRDAFVTSNDTVWVATRTRLGRFAWHPGTAVPSVRWEDFPTPIRHLRPHPDGAWVLTDKGLYVRHHAGHTVTVLDEAHRCWFARPDVAPDGTLALTVEWYGPQAPRGAGVWVIRPDGTVQRRIHSEHGRPAGPPRAVVFDDEGALWLGAMDGLYRLDRPEQLAIYRWEALSGFHYLQLDPTGEALWLNSWDGLYRFASGRLARMSTPGRGSSIPSIAPDGTVRWGERRLENVFAYQEGQRRAGPSGRQLLWAHPDGTRYYLTADGWLRVRTGSVTRIPGLRGRHAVGPAPAYRLWVAGPDGSLDTIEGGVLGSRHPERLPPSVRALIERFQGHALRNFSVDAAGRVWVALRSHGLVVLVPQPGGAWTARRYGRADGLIAGTVTWVQAAPSGRLWVATERGVQGFAPVERGNRRAPDLRTLHIIDRRDGLPLEHVTGVLEDRAGTLWIVPTLAGHLVRYRLGPSDTLGAPPLRITAIRVNGRPLPMPNLPPLRADTTRLAFDVAPQSFRRVRELRYEYRLAGLDTTWSALEGAPTIRFDYLPPGRYTLEVRARRDAQLPGPVFAQPVVLDPPFHQARWFYAVIVLGLGLLGTLGYRWRVRRYAARQRELERLVAARTRTLRREKRTTERQARQLRALDAAKSRFFANISHEFRTPLTLIQSPIEDLLQGRHGALSAAARESLTLVRSSAGRLLTLINELLALSRLEAGRMELTLAPDDLVGFLQKQVRRFAPVAERKGLTLRFVPDVPALPLRFDADKLEQVVSNLLSNAVKFTPAGGKVLVFARVSDEGAVEAHPDADAAPADRVEIVVKDTGPGIPKDELDRLFDRFYQVDGSTTRRHEGTGIGLALARELVELHDGHLLAESEPGFGSAFIVRLPHRVPSDGQQGAEDERPETPPGGLPDGSPTGSVGAASNGAAHAGADAPAADAENPTVLVVEDHAEVRAYLRTHLGEAYRVLEATDGRAGLAAVRRHRPDLVLSDVMMPEMDGFALCQAIKEEEQLRTTPVMLLTARADVESTREGLGLGADDYLVKPFDAEELLLRVEGLLRVRRQLRARYRDEVVLQPSDVVVDSQEADFLKRVRAVVDAHLGDTSFTVERLAHEVGLSRRQLLRRLKAITGQTTSDFIRRMRLERAAQLLEQNAGTVQEVAYAVGYTDTGYFARRFRQVFGETPSAYRDRTATDA